jgi:hypothetical protein
MAQLSSIASLVATGVSTYATISQTQKQDSYRKEQRAAAARQAEAQDRQAQIALAEKARERSAALRRTIAAARARLAASGVKPDEGSSAALTAGLRQDAAAQAADDATYAARLSAGRRSLLYPDASLTAYARAGQSIASSLRSLLD